MPVCRGRLLLLRCLSESKSSSRIARFGVEDGECVTDDGVSRADFRGGLRGRRRLLRLLQPKVSLSERCPCVGVVRIKFGSLFESLSCLRQLTVLQGAKALLKKQRRLARISNQKEEKQREEQLLTVHPENQGPFAGRALVRRV